MEETTAKDVLEKIRMRLKVTRQEQDSKHSELLMQVRELRARIEMLNVCEDVVLEEFKRMDVSHD